MGLFGLGKSKVGSVKKKSPLDIVSMDEMTGCLYYLLYNLKSMTIKVVGKKDDFTCKIAEIDNKKELLYITVLGRATISNTDEVELKVDIAEIRYVIKLTAKKHSTEHDLCLEYPTVIRHFERRKQPRAIFRKNENLDIKVVTDLFGGYGASARLNNVSSKGFNCTISKIVKVDSGKDISVNPLTFKPGTDFALVKFRLPGFGDVEVAGKSIHVSQSGYNLNCGGKFVGVSGPGSNILDGFVSKRSYSPIPPDYQAFHKKFLEDQNKAKEKPKEAPKKPEVEKTDPDKRDYTKVSENTEVAEHHEEDSALNLARDDETYMHEEEGASGFVPSLDIPVSSRKESILLVFYDSEEINLLQDILKNRGFVNISAVNNFAQALKLMTEQQFSLIMLDYDLGGQITAEQFITTLKKHPTLRELPIAIILDSVDPTKQAKIISLKVSRVSLRPMKDRDIHDTVDKILGG